MGGKTAKTAPEKPVESGIYDRFLPAVARRGAYHPRGISQGAGQHEEEVPGCAVSLGGVSVGGMRGATTPIGIEQFEGDPTHLYA